MQIEYGYDIAVALAQPTAVHSLLEVHPDRRNDIVNEQPLTLNPSVSSALTIDSFGNRLRRYIIGVGETTFSQRGVILDSGELDRAAPDARQLDVWDLPPEALQFLLGSRYCEVDKISNLAWNLFGNMAGGYGRVQAICDFVHNHIVFNYADARGTRTAMEGYEEGRGVCRDFAHLLIAFCRALNIPARYINGYLGDIGVPPDPAPMDFSAWVEVYLDGGWYTFDPRHNKRRIGRIVVARGRDAADVPMLHSFGPHLLTRFDIVAREVTPPVPVEQQEQPQQQQPQQQYAAA